MTALGRTELSVPMPWVAPALLILLAAISSARFGVDAFHHHRGCVSSGRRRVGPAVVHRHSSVERRSHGRLRLIAQDGSDGADGGCDDPDDVPASAGLLESVAEDDSPRLPDGRRRGRGSSSSSSRRREVLAALSAAAVATAVSLPGSASAASTAAAAGGGLEDLDLGEGRWVPKKSRERGQRGDDSSLVQRTTRELLTDEKVVPAPFAAYAARFLIRYDSGMNSWWDEQEHRYSLLSAEERRDRMGRAFGCLATSVRIAIERFVLDGADYSGGLDRGVRDRFGELSDLLLGRYGGENKKDDEVERQVGLLFAMLPGQYQPGRAFGKKTATVQRGISGDGTTAAAEDGPPDDDDEFTTEEEMLSDSRVPSSLFEDLAALLPPEYRARYDPSAQRHAILPHVNLFSVGVDDEFGQNAVATPFGPVASAPLRREVPDPTPHTYALFGLSGGVGCALTHTVVIPLDVVKTRLQTDPDAYDGIADGAATIWNEEGPAALLLGAQATIAGYLWYGVSVYPSYSWFKHVIGCTLLSPDVAVAHANDVAIIAGALSAVLASIGLTPIEAARIRTVAEPETYRSGGLVGALLTMSREDPDAGPFGTLYAGFPSLVTRQVVFGSIKFLSFERACAAIYSLWPFLRDATATSLAVSLVAGGIAGALSSVVSQPADSVLTYIAQQEGGGGSGGGKEESGGGSGGGGGRVGAGGGMGVIEGSRLLIEEDGPGALFRGLGSRCLWAGSIIAGQFFLYDIFRTAFHVNADDLTQVFEVVIR